MFAHHVGFHVVRVTEMSLAILHQAEVHKEASAVASSGAAGRLVIRGARVTWGKGEVVVIVIVV